MKFTLLRVHNLKKFETIRALDDISLDITQGEFVAIMGPSGSGESTLMNIIGCLDTSDEGLYVLDGKQIHSLKDSQLAEIRKIGFVFQSCRSARSPETLSFRIIWWPAAACYHRADAGWRSADHLGG
jgi:ABC-type Fe3+/spermidine/putrescine transport system ATPase subunit